MKRLLAMGLALCLMCTSALAEVEVAVMSFVRSGTDMMLDALAVLNGELYGLSYDGLYRLTDGAWDMVFPQGGLETMAAADGRLYLLAREFGGDELASVLYAAEPGEDGALGEPERLFAVDWGLTLDYPQFHGFAVAGEAAWVLLYDDMYSGPTWNSRLLMRVSMADGRAERMGEGALEGLTAYKTGQLLSLRDDSEIVAIDTADGKITVLAAASSEEGSAVGGLAYDAAASTICYRTHAGVFGLDGELAPTGQLGYLLPTGASLNGGAVIHDGYYYTTDWSSEGGYVSCAIDPNLLPARRLRIATSYSVDEQTRAFAKLHPEIAVEYLDGQPVGAESILRSMQSENAADIYEISLDWSGFTALRDKGYLAELTASEVLMEVVQCMYPQLTQELLVDGRLYALPIALYATVPGYFPDALEKAGLSEADVPGSYEELMDFIVRWEQEFYDDFPEMSIYTSVYDLREQLFADMLTAQLLLSESRGEALTFDTPELCRLLERLEEIRPVIDEVVPEPESYGNVVVVTTGGGGNELFTNSINPMPSSFGMSLYENARPMLLSLGEDDPPVISASMTVMVLNPYSQNLDIAMELLTYVAQNLPQTFRAAIMPGENEPIESAFYWDRVRNYQERLDELAAYRESADPAEYADIDEMIEAQQARLARVEEQRWAFSEEDIADYRAHIAPYLMVTASSYFSIADQETETLARRYLDGQIGLRQFISEFDRMVTMKRMENE